MTPVLWAFGSLVCGGLNDFVFKLYRRKHRPVGSYVALIGLVWAGVFATLAAPHALWQSDAVTLRWGLISGACSVVSNLLLIRAMAHHDVGVCSTIFRLNLAPAALLAFFWLGEPVTGMKLGGIGAALLAILLFFNRDNPNDRSVPVLVIVACLLRAGMGIAYKRGLDAGADTLLLPAWNGVLWLVGGLLYAAFQAGPRQAPPIKTGIYGIASGLLIAGIVFCMAFALKAGEASVILPITQLSFVLTSLLGVFVLGEALAPRKLAGLGLAVLSVVLLTLA